MNLLFRVRWLILLWLAAGPAVGRAQTPGPSPMVRWDWYFRESLVAIDDWEAILEQLDETGEQAAEPFRFPVPADGRTVEWTNPIPRRLLPDRDGARPLRLRTTQGGCTVQRVTSDQRGSAVAFGEEQTLAAGESLVGYQHPGGGGHDQWYHEYVRRFDRVGRLQPVAAPLAVQLTPPHAYRPGPSTLCVTLRNATPAPLAVTLQLDAWHCRRELQRPGAAPAERGPADRSIQHRSSAAQTVTLAGEAERSLTIDFDLPGPGGGLLLLRVAAAGSSFRLPLLTHVADVPAVLAGVRALLAETPDAEVEESAKRCERDAQLLLAGGPARGAAWSALFERASALRDALLLRRIEFDSLLLVRRKPFYSEQPFMDAHHCYNRPGGGLYRLSPVQPDGQLTPLADRLGLGIYRDLCLHWDARTLLFSFGNGADRTRQTTGGRLSEPEGKADYDLYEVAIDGSRLRQLTAGPKNDCEPFYLPNGQLGFTSDRSGHYVMCGSDIHAANLFIAERDGSRVRQLSHNLFNEFHPSLLPDGRILYNRWEYNERSVTSLHDLFTMHPDGSQVAPYYGNATFRPNVILFPRAVPGSSQVMALFTGHHGQTHGPVGLIDVRRGLDGPGPLTILTPGVPVIGERIEDSRRGWYSDPQPLSETTFLCSYTPTVRPWLEASWAIYVGDRHGNLALVYRDPDISCAEPVPLVRRPRPATLPSVVAESADAEAEAELLLLDVQQGLTGVSRGLPRSLRVLEDVPRKDVPTGGVICTSGTQIYTVKRILGTVPIEPDGSAYLRVPADRNLYFSVLDERGREIQRMRSVVCLKPGQRTTCIGCHEPRQQAPPVRRGLAFARPPSRLAEPPWGTRTISFLRDVQPVLDAQCVRCHAHDRPANRVLLTDELTDQFCIGYEELLPYLRVANAMRWDHPEDVYAQPPYHYGSNASPLVQLLAGGHYDVALSAEQWQRLQDWIDANAVYYDRYETYTDNRHIFTGHTRRELQSVFTRRCATCHGGAEDGRFDSWWLTLNHHDVRQSRALQAPLARSAGGWQRCAGIVFADTADADYRQLASQLESVAATLDKRPRADLLSLEEGPP